MLGPVHVSGSFWKHNFFFLDTPSVHTYLLSRLDFINPLWIQSRVDAKSGNFFYPDDVTRPSPVPYHKINCLLLGLISRDIMCVQLNIGMNTAHFNYMYAKRHMLCYLCFLEEACVLEWIRIPFDTSEQANPIWILVWMGILIIFWIWIKKYPDTCGSTGS